MKRFLTFAALLTAFVAIVSAQERQRFTRGIEIIDHDLLVYNTPAGGDSGYGVKFVIEPTGAELRQGGLDINLTRTTGNAMDWGGSPDSALNIRADNRANNTSGGGLRAIDANARNRGTNSTWVKAFDLGARNDNGSQLTDSIQVAHLRLENYGNVATSASILDLEFSDENSNVDPHTKNAILVRNTDASGMGAVDAVMLISHTSTNGFNALFDFDGVTAGANTTIIDQITAAASTAAYQIRVVMPDGNSGWINVYSTSGTGP